MLGFTGADADRVGHVYFCVLVVAVGAGVGLDRTAWRTAPESAIDAESEPEPLDARR